MYAWKVKSQNIFQEATEENHTHTLAHLQTGKLSEAGSTSRPLTRFDQNQKENYLYLKPIPQAWVSTELISETNKENQVCEKRGFAPHCLEFGHPAERAPHSQRVGAPSVTLTFPAPPARVPAAPESASPPLPGSLLACCSPNLQNPRVCTLRAPRSPTSALSDARRGGAMGTEGAGQPNKCHTGRLPSPRESGQDGRHR